MEYKNIVAGRFLKRPNRFIAHVELNGRVEIAHVKNTGRCKELLVPGNTVYLEPSDNPQRKTKFSLIAVEKGTILINMDSQAPNTLLEERLKAGRLEGFPYPLDFIRREYTYGDSRLDLYLEHSGRKTLVEIKGVTLEKDGVVLFPDAPTQRGVKHIHQLAGALDDGYEAMICFIAQLDKADYFTPNMETHPEFGYALKQAMDAGVKVVAYSCRVTPDSLNIKEPIPVRLDF